MPKYIIKTTVDITRANPGRDEQDQIKHGQQQNFNSLIQGIGLRSNIDWEMDPYQIDNNGTAEWIWEFTVDQVDVFAKGSDPVGLLKEDLQGIPIIKNLNETAELTKPIFITGNGDQNIWVNAAKHP